MSWCRPILVLLALCLSLVAPAQAAGLLSDGSRQCRQLHVEAASADHDAAREGTVAAPCQLPGVPVEAAALPPPEAAVSDPFPVEVPRAVANRPGAIERPPRRAARTA